MHTSVHIEFIPSFLFIDVHRRFPSQSIPSTINIFILLLICEPKKQKQNKKRKNSYSKAMHVSNHSTTQTNHDIVVAADCLPGGICFWQIPLFSLFEKVIESRSAVIKIVQVTAKK
ncbi:hypothetical protein EYC84_008581 [Monilinia fructicola]|uniref:Uncharacterized protein n=1 Tax=Monilinia fructicola TaxID=38448 RepID=A0A5M9JHQ2_MONFR|nr:hypothetical protein EYC84_008581 [Monilinia fructicola]